MAASSRGNATGHHSGEEDAYRLPPQNLEAEQGVLGSILLDNDMLDEVLPVLRAEDFYRDAHQIVYRAVRDLYDAAKAVDAVTLSEELTRLGVIDEVGGIEFIAEVVNSVPHAANARYYADIVKQKSVSRAVIEACNETLREAYSNQHTAESLCDNLYRRASEAAEGGTKDNVTDLREPLAAFADRMDDRRHGPTGILSGFPDLDSLTDGWQDGMLYVIAGRPSMGKSAMALNVADVAAHHYQAPVLFFSLEMRSLELSERLVCAEAGISSHRIRDPNNLDQAEMIRFADAYARLRGTPLYFDDSPLYNVTQISAIARKHKRKSGVRMVVIDYLQLLDMEDGSRANRQEQVAKTSRRLKVLARTLDVPVILLSQLNRQSESREDKRPRMSDLRESGSVEQDADVVILVHRPDRYDANDQPGIVELIVDKNRNGATGVVKVGNRLDQFRLNDLAGNQFVPRMPEDAHDPRAAAAGDF